MHVNSQKHSCSVKVTMVLSGMLWDKSQAGYDGRETEENRSLFHRQTFWAHFERQLSKKKNLPRLRLHSNDYN